MKKTIFYSAVIVLVTLTISSCRKTENIVDTPTNQYITTMDNLIAEDYFNFNTFDEISVRVTAKDNQNLPISGVKFTVYGDFDEGETSMLIRGFSNNDGVFEGKFKYSSYLDSIIIGTNFVGLPSQIKVPVDNDHIDLLFGGKTEKQSSGFKSLTGTNSSVFKYLGTFNSLGVPDYLVENDQVTAEFLQQINATLPERYPVPVAHPEYLASGNTINIEIVQSAEVWVTFVHEGAGYKNSLGFYTYPTNDPPASADEIDTISIIFPNASFLYSGGGMASGNKVNIGIFSPGTTIAWVVIANGWNGSGVSTTKPRFYSDSDFNPENSEFTRQHNVILYDEITDRYILGFDDQNRNGVSDEDFNDALFFITSNPIEGIDNANVLIFDPAQTDTDGDGVSDLNDDYPNDSQRAINSYYPSSETYGNLIFEDLWPQKGDYDFNDMVINYRYLQIQNGENKVVEIQAEFIVKAVGAGYKNGFGFEIPISNSLISSVTGYNINYGLVTLNSNGTEANQSNAVIIVFDNVYNIFPTISHGYINTKTDMDYVNPETININIILTQPVAASQLGIPSYNPFIFINEDRGREVHLPNYAPTNLMDNTYFGTEDDDSNPGSNRYYKTVNNLPWAMDLIENFDYPLETKEITNGHLNFGLWVQSSGANYNNWYKDLPDYRNSANLYYIP